LFHTCGADLGREAIDDVRGHHDRLLHFVELLRSIVVSGFSCASTVPFCSARIHLGEGDRRRIRAARLRRCHVGRDVRHADLEALHAGAVGERLLRGGLPGAIVRVREDLDAGLLAELLDHLAEDRALRVRNQVIGVAEDERIVGDAEARVSCAPRTTAR
jgi:hypothetical protein